MPHPEIPIADVEGDRILYFFFSYARKDLNPYLERFFKDLGDRVENLAAREGISFRDLQNMEPADSWPEALATALQKSRVLVALYSRWYFARPYCGKEVQVFLERQKNAAGKIMPILWHSKDWLSGSKLPPQSVANIHYEHRDFPPQYLEQGLSILAQNRGPVYKKLLEACAKRIIVLAENDPLPPYPEPPNLEKMRNAFEVERDLSFAPPAAAPEPAGTAQGPRRIHLLFVGAPAVPWDWKPFGAASPQDFRRLVEEVLDPRSDIEGTAVASIPRELLLEIRSRNALPILIIDHGFLGNPEGRQALVSVIDDEKIDCGFLVILPEEAKATENRTEWLQFGQRNKARSLAIAGSGKELQESLSRIVAELCQRTVESGSVHQPVEGEGPLEKPLLRGPGRAS
jgi:hypothetical protein